MDAKITVNESLRWLNKNKKHFYHSLESVYDKEIETNIKDEGGEILSLIKKLPLGYRVVFNLYVIEGFSHKEIAKKLQIKESSSRSQLVRAKKMLKDKIVKLKYYKNAR